MRISHGQKDVTINSESEMEVTQNPKQKSRENNWMSTPIRELDKIVWIDESDKFSVICLFKWPFIEGVFSVRVL